MLRSIALYPILDCARRLHAVRARFDPLAHRVPPHVTLVFPFESGHGREAIARVMAQALDGLGPFRLVLDPPVALGDTVQLPLASGAAMARELHDRLYSGLLRPFLREDLPYLPHITVGQGLGPDARPACLEAASALAGAAGFAPDLACELIGPDGSSRLELDLPFAAPGLPEPVLPGPGSRQGG